MQSIFEQSSPFPELCQLSIKDLIEKIESRKLTCSELIDQYLERIHYLQKQYQLNAFITLLEKQSLEEAKLCDEELQKGQKRGALHGIPIAIKDNLEMAHVRTTAGTAILAENSPTEDATVIQKLKQAGAIIIGKTNMHELAFGITNKNPHYGDAKNPYDLNKIPGGSSGGSAVAVAAGLCAAAIGTDTGSSIRIPSSLCGVVGLKPTLGKVGRGGLIYLSTTFDCIGPITRCTEDTKLLLEAIQGDDNRDKAELSSSSAQTKLILLQGKTSLNPSHSNHSKTNTKHIGLLTPYATDDLDNEVSRLFQQTIEKLSLSNNFKIHPISLPNIDQLVPAGFTICLAETVHLLKNYLNNLSSPIELEDVINKFGNDVKQAIGEQYGQADSKPKSGYEYLDALNNFREPFNNAVSQIMQHLDAIITPTTPLPAIPMSESEETWLNGESVDTFMTFIRYTLIANMTGRPAISIPMGITQHNLPVGVQLIGHCWQDEELIKLAEELNRL